MTYANCFNQSTTGRASVKCTYAEVCNPAGIPIFVFQKARFSGPIAVASFDPVAIRPNSKIQAELTPDAVEVLTSYYNRYVANTSNHNKRRLHTSNYRYLSDYFDASGKMISNQVTINPYRYDWTPGYGNNKKSNLAFAVAAASALLD